jgi:hypothetical protein
MVVIERCCQSVVGIHQRVCVIFHYVTPAWVVLHHSSELLIHENNGTVAMQSALLVI